jgi:hypothetical protein
MLQCTVYSDVIHSFMWILRLISFVGRKSREGTMAASLIFTMATGPLICLYLHTNLTQVIVV